jgi:hypothetical protein
MYYKLIIIHVQSGDSVRLVRIISTGHIPTVLLTFLIAIKGKKGKEVPLHAMEAFGGEEV